MSDVHVTPELLATLEQKAVRASRGPWVFNADNGNVEGPEHGQPLHRAEIAWMRDAVSSCGGCSTHASRYADGGFIAAASPSVVLALVSYIRDLETKVKRLRKAAQDYAGIERR